MEDHEARLENARRRSPPDRPARLPDSLRVREHFRPRLASREARSIDISACHASARALYAYWRRIHPPDGLPGRQHFDPAAVVALLPNIVLVEVQRDPLRFRYRLLGSRIDSVNGKNLSGQWLDEAYADHAKAAALLREYAQVVETGQPIWRRSEPRVVPMPDCRAIEVLRLPLASDGQAIDMILGLTLYFDSAGKPLESLAYRTLGFGAAETVR
ncbi:MAG: PAS domain-containing protein [Proteobacteria bacterium]|nr:PAS domain-containing protein [Pseudomonadota bacterium]